MKNKGITIADVTDTDKDNNKGLFSMDRRTFVKMAGTAIGAMALGTEGISRLIQTASASAITPFADPLFIPPVAIPIPNKKYRGADYYEIPIVQSKHRFHSSLDDASAYGFDGATYLGPTIVANKDRPVVIKFTNKLPLGKHLFHDAIDTTIMGASPDVEAAMNWKPGDPLPPHWDDENRVVIHLHGGKTAPQFDGHPRAWFSPVGSKQVNPYPEAPAAKNGSFIYKWSNEQPSATLWYHDHAWGITRFNPFAGMAAAYLIRDIFEDDLIKGTNNGGKNRSGQKIPGGSYEVPIVLQDKLLDLNSGSMVYPNEGVTAYHPEWIPEYFGDIPVVNGTAYPYLDVEPRRYRFHFLNGSNARFYNIWFDNGSGQVPMWVIGSDQGFLPASAKISKLLISPGERFDVIFDFTGMQANTTLTLMNDANEPYPNGDKPAFSQIMQFRIKKKLKGKDSTTPAKALKLPPIASIRVSKTPRKSWREIVLQESMDPVTDSPKEILLDGRHFTESLDNPELFLEMPGKKRVWQFINLTVDAHPMHIHLVAFKVVNRQPFDVGKFTDAWNAWIAGGRAGKRPTINDYLIKKPYAPAPEEKGWKDTAKAYPGEVLRVATRFDLPSGVESGNYVSHCHILEHEENDMMLQFRVQKAEAAEKEEESEAGVEYIDI